MCVTRRDFIKTTGVLGACALCCLPGFSQRSKFSAEPYTCEDELPTKFQLDVCTICQLNCVQCPTRQIRDENNHYGYMRFKDFKKFVDTNRVTAVELSSKGEIFLNPELLDIIKYAHKKNIILTAYSGVNGNDISDDVAEALVKYQIRDIQFSIDGASQEIYSLYRIGGDFDKVIANIKKINALKTKYNSEFPKMTWKYIMFGHNVCDMVKAKQMADELGMSMYYSTNNIPDYSPLTKKDHNFIKKVTKKEKYFLGFKTDLDVVKSEVCNTLFNVPQISYNGQLLGCCCNNYSFYKANAFETDLMTVLNNPDYLYSKRMITGQVPDDTSNPCSRCFAYKNMKKKGSFICA